jgi:carbonic anhydrase
MFQIDQKNSFTELDPIVSSLKNSVVGGSMQNITGVNALTWLRKYIDSDCNCTKGAYYTYVGSLTTPPCTENVNWIVMANTGTIGALQVSFQAVKFKLAQDVLCCS